MTRRRQKRSRRRATTAIARGDEPPDPISLSTATLIAAGLGSATAIATPFISKAVAPKPPKQPKLSPGQTTPLGGDTQLKPGQVANLKNTGPQGLLSPATTGRATLLGG